MTLLGNIDPLNLASLKPVTADSLAANEQAAAQARASQIQAAASGVKLVGEVNEQQRTQAFQNELAAVNKAPSPEALIALMNKYPEFAPHLKPGVDRLDAQEKEKLAAQIMDPWAAGHNGRPDLMAEKLKALAAGYESKGMKDKAAGIQNLLTDIAQNPHIATAKLDAMLLGAVGPERFNALTSQIGADSKRRKDAADALLAEANTNPLKIKAALDEAMGKAQKELAEAKDADARFAAQTKVAQINAQYAEQEKKQGLATLKAQEGSALASTTEQQRQTTEGTANAPVKARELAAKTTIEEGQAAGDYTPDKRNDVVLKAQDEAKDMRAKAIIARQLEDRYAKLRGSSFGAIARLQENWKSLWGNEDKRSQLFTLANGVINQDLTDQAQKLKPVSDTDMALIRQGVPVATADHKIVQQYMGTLATALEKQAEAKLNMAAYINKNGGPGEAKRDFEIRGKKVLKGTTMEEFLSVPQERSATAAATAAHPAVAALPAEPKARLDAINARLAQLGVK